MVLKTVKDKHPFCPQCGRKRGVTLRKESHLDGYLIDPKGEQTDYYICCNNCKRRWLIIDFGIWTERVEIHDC